MTETILLCTLVAFVTTLVSVNFLADRWRCISHGHSFEPRYSYGAAPAEAVAKILDLMPDESLDDLIEAAQPATYEGDICPVCGDVRDAED